MAQQAAGLSQNDTDIDNFLTKTKFMKKESTTAKTLQLGRLTNEIFPLFGEEMFVEHDGFKPDFDVLEQPARLASRLLQCGAADRLLKRIVMPEKNHVWVDPNDYKKFGLEDDIGSGAVTEKDRGFIRQWLVHLSKYTEIVVSKDIETGATTTQLGENHIFEEECPDGFSSTVSISSKMYNALVEATKDPNDVPRLLMLRFEFAVMLVHEMTHALHNIRRGRLDHEPFIGDSEVSELGYEMENELFGGHLTRLYSDGDPDDKQNVVLHKHDEKKSRLVGVPVIWEYPYQGLVEEHRAIGEQMPVRVEPKDNRQYDLAWRVSPTFVQRFLTDDF